MGIDFDELRLGIKGDDELPPSTEEAILKYLNTVYEYESTIWCAKSSIVAGAKCRIQTAEKAIKKLIEEGKIEQRIHNNRKGYRIVVK